MLIEALAALAVGRALFWVGRLICHKVKKPAPYTWETCPIDHDTYSRYGHKGPCPECGNEL